MKNVNSLILGLSFVLISLPSALLAQTGVAGVGNSSTNVVWLDAHALGLANGSNVSTATDFSGNNNHFTQSNTAKQPLYTTAGVNGMSVMTYDGTDDFMDSGSISALESTNMTYFMVFQRTNLKSQMMINAKYASQSPAKWRLYNNTGSNNMVAGQFSPTIKYVTAVDDGDPTFISHHMTPTQIQLYREGTLTQQKNQGYIAPTGHQDVQLGGVFPSGNNYFLDGFVAEVAIYNTALNPLERIFVENYMGAKYGITIPTDLYAYESTHQLDLIAIGDDGTDTQTAAEGKEILNMSGATGMTSGEFLLVANTDDPLNDFTTSDIPASIAGHQRFTRTWRAGETGDVGTVTLAFDLAGPNDFANSTTYNLLTDADGDFSNATVTPGVYAAGVVTFTVNLADGEYFTVSGLEEILEIHSIVTGDWSVPGTWDCTCIPGANDEVYIDPGTSVTVDVDANVGYFLIDAGGKLNMDDPFTLNIFQDFEIDGTADFTDGTVAMVGFAPQYIDAFTGSMIFHDLDINNAASAQVDIFEGTYTLDGTLHPTKGSLVIDGAADFIVNSSGATTSGRIGAIVNPFTFTGDFTVRRNLPAGNADWRGLCSPVIGATFDDWDPDLAMSGPNFPDGCAFGVDCFNSVQFVEKGIYYDVNNSTDVIQNRRGYEVFVGDDLSTWSGTTLNQKGTLNDGNDITHSFLGGNWWTVGNPYASPITFNNISKLSQVGDYFYVYDANTGSYQWYDNSDNSTSLPAEITSEGRIAMGQSVWLFVGGPSQMTFSQSDKTSNTATYIRGQEHLAQDLRITLAQDNSTYECTMALVKSMEGTDGMDSLVDMRHLEMPNQAAPSIAFAFAEDNVRKNYIADDHKDKTFELYTNILNDGYYTITAANIQAFNDYLNVLIYDKEENEFFDLKLDAGMTFYAEAGINERFQLILSNEAVNQQGALGFGTEELSTVSINQMGNLVEITTNHAGGYENVEISLFNVLGQREVYVDITNIQEGSTVITLPDNLKGVQVLSLNINGERITKKLVF